ncbi:MAG TPA: serine protease, partial [Burkholderiaceae bacterium]
AVVKIEAGGQGSSGFLWPDKQHVVTALHAVDVQATPVVHEVNSQGQIRNSQQASVAQVLRHADLALLKLPAPLAAGPLEISPQAPQVKDALDALGFPLNMPSVTNVGLKLRFGGSTLGSILPPKLRAMVADYPSLQLGILSLEGNLVPGMSGAPLLDAAGRVVGVADGGLEEGAVGICWGVPASQLEALRQSRDRALPGSRRVRELFSADLAADVQAGPRTGDVNLTKLRSRSFAQLAASVDDQLGMAQLSVGFAMFKPEYFRYDIYQDLRSGATLAVPEGAKLRAAGAYIEANVGDPRYALRIQVLASESHAQAVTQAQAFEFALAKPGPGKTVQVDPQWSYFQPIMRGPVLVNRKAYARFGMQGGMPSGEQYFFETIATNGRSFLGVAAINNDVRPATLMLEQACGMGQPDPRCAAVYRSRSLWAQLVLGTQFASFPLNGAGLSGSLG